METKRIILLALLGLLLMLGSCHSSKGISKPYKQPRDNPKPCKCGKKKPWLSLEKGAMREIMNYEAEIVIS